MALMMSIVIGTTNPAKARNIGAMLVKAGFHFRLLTELEAKVSIVEDGKTSQENAHIKALTYTKAIGEAVLAADGSLFFDDIPEEYQPGTHIRRIHGRTDRPSDEELLEYYRGVFEKFGGKVDGRFEDAICITTPDGKVYETTIVSPRIFTAVVAPVVARGNPLSSLQFDPVLEKYISQMTQEEQDAYWYRLVGAKLIDFLNSTKEQLEALSWTLSFEND
jgi:XTP/dITP diphosphohydrolase